MLFRLNLQHSGKLFTKTACIFLNLDWNNTFPLDIGIFWLKLKISFWQIREAQSFRQTEAHQHTHAAWQWCTASCWCILVQQRPVHCARSQEQREKVLKDRVEKLLQKKKRNFQCQLMKNKKESKRKINDILWRPTLSGNFFKTQFLPLLCTVLHVSVSWPRWGWREESSKPDNLANSVSFHYGLADNLASLESHRLIRKVNFTNLFSERWSLSGNTA